MTTATPTAAELAGWTESRKATLREEVASATGMDASDFWGCNALTSLRAAERAGATIFWGCLPPVDFLRHNCL